MSRALLLCSILPAAVASATVLRPMALEDLVAEADAIVYARVVAAHWEGTDAENVRTCATLVIEENMKGSARDEIRVCERGGRLPSGETLSIAGTPRYAPGTAVLAMLSERPDGSFRTVGFSQGVFLVLQDTAGRAHTLVRELDQVSWITANGAVSDNAPATVPTRVVATTMFAQIRAWVRGAR